MHESVLLKESVDCLKVRALGKYIDATLGAGGHSLEILKRGGNVLGIEADKQMLEIASKNVKPEKWGSRIKLVQGNFRDIGKIARENRFDEVDGVLFDLGISSVHLDNDNRGFSFKKPDDYLDMRLDPSIQAVTAAQLLNSLNERQLSEILESRSMARVVIDKRNESPFEKVSDLLAIFNKRKRGKIHPATKTFMNLRIAVNSEYENLESAIPQAFSLLKKSGRIAVISFHSGEDRIVKRYFKKLESEGLGKVWDLIMTSNEEKKKNKRARSAKLRIIEKL